MLELNFVINPVPLLVDIGIFFCIYLILSLSLNLEYGYAGIPNFGKSFFVGVAGLVAGSLSYRLAVYLMQLKSSDIIAQQASLITQVDTNLAHNLFLSAGIFMFVVVVGALLGAVFGYLASYPAIKLREDYLAMLLLASGEFLNVFAQSYYPLTGGTQGLLVPDPLNFSVSSGTRDYVMLGISSFFAIIIFLYAQRVGNSPLGRTLRAIRDNEIATLVLGKNNVAIRRNVLIVGSALCGIAGALWVTWTTAISPTTFTRQTFTFIPWLIVILGGASNNVGVALGSFVYVAVYEILTQLNVSLQATGIVVLPNWLNLSYIELIAFGVVLILILMVKPEGLIREKWSKSLSKKELESIKKRIKGNT